MCLLSPIKDNPIHDAYAKLMDELMDTQSPDWTGRTTRADKAMRETAREHPGNLRGHAEWVRQALGIRRRSLIYRAADPMPAADPCDLCNGSGTVTVEYPYRGNSLEQVMEDCPCCGGDGIAPPDPPDWQDVPELWALDSPGIHYDATLPSGLLATQRLNDLQAVDPLA